MSKNCIIKLENVSLVYDLNYEGVYSLKTKIINFLMRRRPPVDRPDVLNALDGINITINQGERVGIIGLNGSGKSTFLKVAAGILKPQIGNIETIGNIQPLIEIGAGFNPEFSGRENMYLNGAMLGFSPQQISEREEEIIQFSELQDFIDIPVKYYSSGMSVRLAFTIATMIQPEVLLMDEMLSAGDLSFIEKAKGRMEKILNNAKILLLVSHDLGLVSSLTTRCLVMEKGKVLFDGETEKAIEFYKEKTIEKLERQKDEAGAKGAELASSTKVTNLKVSLTDQRVSIEPNSEAKFSVQFDLTKDFSEIYVNLVILDKLGTLCIHLRNDYEELKFVDAKVGSFRTMINISKFPLRSGSYNAYARIVAKTKDDTVIVDSDKFYFDVLDGKKRTVIVENQWAIDGPLTVVKE